MRLTIAVLILLSAPLAARERPAPPPAPGTGPNGQPVATIVAEPAAMMIAACDADGDGRTTAAELTACIARSFAAIDTTHTGSIGYIGYSDWALRWLGDRNALPSPFSIDTDGDNRITPAELQASFAALFARFDIDRNGAATRAELLTIRAGGGAARPDGRRRGDR